MFELLRGTIVVLAEETLMLAVVGVSGELVLDESRRSLNRCIVLKKGEQAQIQAHIAYIAAIPGEHPGVALDWKPTIPNSLRYLSNGDKQAISATVDPVGSRAGIRLNAETGFETREQPSEPSCPGAIQCTPSGQLIVIGPDGPTIGGYPRIGTVIDADLDLIPRMSAHQVVMLASITLEAALVASNQRNREVQQRIQGIKISRGPHIYRVDYAG